MNNKAVNLDPTIKKQILAVRDTGRTNMFDTNAVQCIANSMSLFELADFLTDRNNKKIYSQFILYGDGENKSN